MKLSFAFLADSATVPPDGKLYVLGGGFSTMVFPELPARATFAVVAGFRFTSADTGVTHEVELRFLDSAGKLMVAPGKLQFQSAGTSEPDLDVSIPTVTFLAPTFAEPGMHVIEFWHLGQLLSSIALGVQERQTPQLGERPN